MNQTDFAAVAGASKRAMVSWEKDESAPVVTALLAWSEAGADALYILSGERAGGPSRAEVAHDYRRNLDELEDRLERHAIGLNDLSADELYVIELELTNIATSRTPAITSTYRERADDLLRNHFNDEGAAKRRQQRFLERNRRSERGEAQLYDMVKGLSLNIPSGVMREFLVLMLNYRINANDLFPIFGEMKKALDAEESMKPQR